MTWLAWRQFRVQAAVAAGFLLIAGVVLALTGPHLLHLYDSSVRHCHVRHDCGTATLAFARTDKFLQHISILVVLLPALIGIFWGAPMIARELENGTYQLAWTQSVTRTKWLMIKFGLVGTASVVVAGLFSLMVTWWSSPLDRLHNAAFGSFDHRDLVPMGYAALALALGVFLGLVIRRTVPAMAATLVVFVACRLAFTDWIRTHFAAPLHVTSPLFVATGQGPTSPGAGAINPADWVISGTTIDAHGRVIGQFGGIGSNGQISINPTGSTGHWYFAGVGRCPNRFPRPVIVRKTSFTHVLQQALQKCVDHFHLREVLTFQPVSRYWAFQWYELTSYVVLALALAALSVWWVRRRST
jgi:hypothetical protein